MVKVVDKLVPDRDKYKVHEDYATVLNQTNIEGNNNKFYIIQLITDNNLYYVWTRWGRVGENGSNNLENCGNLKSGIAEFKKKFKAKTGNKWEDLKDFKSKDGKYTLVETEDKEGGTTDDSAPVGHLSQAQIEKGQDVLKEIESELANKNELVSVQNLSSKFFSLIPTVTGRKKPQPISTLDMLHQKEELLKFYLRMGFDETEKEDPNLTPISGIMELLLPKTLLDACKKVCTSSDVKASITRGSILAKSSAGNPTKEMDKELYGAILLYTSNAIYKDLNKVLREQNRTAIKKYFEYLRMLFEACDRLPKKEMTLWRGISSDLSKTYKKGEIVTWWGVSSCTTDQNVAKNFMNGCGGDCTFLTIDSKTATDISDITHYSSEKECLLYCGTRLEVLSSEKKGKVAYIHLKEIDRVIS
jgi:predicted DNA-binding WGR domain protein